MTYKDSTKVFKVYRLCKDGTMEIVCGVPGGGDFNMITVKYSNDVEKLNARQVQWWKAAVDKKA